MHYYELNEKTVAWQLKPIPPGSSAGIDKVGKLCIGDTVVTAFGALLPFTDTRNLTQAAFIASPDCPLAVNGLPALPIHILVHKDELSFAKDKIYLSLEKSIEVVDFFAGDDVAVVHCPRCKDVMSGAAVKCPECGLWYHQSEDHDRLCWSYDDKCLVCGHSTGSGVSWCPPARRPKFKWQRRNQGSHND
jgi:hypothetical protein